MKECARNANRFRSAAISNQRYWCFSYFSIWIHAAGTHQKYLTEVILMSDIVPDKVLFSAKNCWYFSYFSPKWCGTQYILVSSWKIKKNSYPISILIDAMVRVPRHICKFKWRYKTNIWFPDIISLFCAMKKDTPRTITKEIKRKPKRRLKDTHRNIADRSKTKTKCRKNPKQPETKIN